ncbi:histamine H2 receptor-like [Hydractinia symbiolongicarpus]|uniref:histamine H2 receptor-like n=1 Tax=Hydractinia symbiolongicarpus TaxID=13093 RepID=UPI00254F5210|nr:histamine H2 receptor-like [Hydractinia symbiolongicarpus]
MLINKSVILLLACLVQVRSSSQVAPSNTSCYEQLSSNVSKTTSMPQKMKNISLTFYATSIALTIFGYIIILPPIVLKKIPSSCFLISLAISDLITALVIVPIKTHDLFDSSKWSAKLPCTVLNCASLYIITVSSLNSLILSVDRLTYFSKPLRYSLLVTRPRAVLICVLAWLFSLPTFLPVIRVGSKTGKPKFCAFKYSMSEVFLLVTGAIYILVPTLITTACQIAIILKIRLSFRLHRGFIGNAIIHNQAVQKHMQITMKREMHIQRTFLLLTIFYYICYVPTISSILISIYKPMWITPQILVVIRILVHSNSFIDPLLMILTNKQIKSSLKKLFCSQRRRVQERFEGGSHDIFYLSSTNNTVTERMSSISSPRKESKVPHGIPNTCL